MNDTTSISAQEEHSPSPPTSTDHARRVKLSPYSHAQYANYYVVDMIQKIRFALAYAMTFDGFERILFAFGTTTDIEDGMLVYFAEGQARTRYSVNRIGELADLDYILERLHKNYEKCRLDTAGMEVRGWDDDAVVPPEVIERARSADIAEYCKREGIALSTSSDGGTVLSARQYILLDRDRWFNAKNRTQGGLLEFVTNYKHLTFVQAVAEITNTPTLRAIEYLFGEVRVDFKAFFLPQKGAKDWNESKMRVESFLAAMGADPQAAKSLVGSGSVEVREDGSIRLYGAERRGGYLVYSDAGGEWRGQIEGQNHSPFYQSQGTGSVVRLYVEPMTYIRTRGKEAITNRRRNDGFLVLLSPEVAQVDAYLARNEQVTLVRFVPASGRSPSLADVDFIRALRERCVSRGVELDTSDFTKAVADKFYG